MAFISNITLKDIAKIAKVSKVAVSKALNDKPDISEETKIRIKKIAKELNYIPNNIARGLATNKTKTIGVFLLTRYKIKDEINRGYDFVDGIIKKANKLGYDIILFSRDTKSKTNKSYIKQATERKVDGIIFIGLGENDSEINEIEKSRIPIVTIDSFLKNKDIISITTDSKKGIVEGLDYLIKKGHREIAAVLGHEEAFVSNIRYKVYKNYMLEKGLFKKEFIFNGDFTLESGYRVGKEILKLKNKPTAIFSFNDIMAMGLIRALNDGGIKVPKDISILGFDNDKMCDFFQPRISTVSQNLNLMGKNAVESLIKKINGKNIENIVLDPKLIIRESITKIGE